MLFQSPAFFALFMTTFVVYQALVGRPRPQKWVLLIASVIFYYAWEARNSDVLVAWTLPPLGALSRILPLQLPLPVYLGMFFVLTWINYAGARIIAAETRDGVRRMVLAAVVCLSFMPLLWFKYAGFIARNLVRVLPVIPVQAFVPAPAYLERLLLPLGISFFTFQLVGYTIDVYRDRRLVSTSVLDVSVFSMLFAHLVAGPIMRADDLLRQVEALPDVDARHIDEGHYFLSRGLVKKVALAEVFGLVVDPVYADLSAHSWTMLGVATAAYGFQIYFDFSGYSDMAIGLGKYFGFDLRQNFRLPYLARSPADFWSRWHITLTSWFRDHVFEPLGGYRSAAFGSIAAIVLTFTASGLWHGARWTFVVWGVYHGVLVACSRSRALRGACARIPSAAQILLTFGLVTIGWVLFRIQSIRELGHLAQVRLLPAERIDARQALVLVIAAYALHVLEGALGPDRVLRANRAVQYAAFAVCLLVCVMMYVKSTSFIYFQF